MNQQLSESFAKNNMISRSIRVACRMLMCGTSCQLLLLPLLLMAIIISCAESLSFVSDLSSKASSTFTTTASCYYLHFTSSPSIDTTHTTTRTASQLLTMKVSGSSKRTRSSKSSHLIELNNERLQTAGRPGTKNFIDPNKVFIGNLPYDATELDITNLFAKHWNVPSTSVDERISSIKIVKDWKTGVSKGYGFIQFYEPMVATSTMETINKGQGKGWRIKGRRIRLDQGKHKESEEDMRLLKAKKKKEKETIEEAAKKKKKQLEDLLDEEGKVIHSVLEDVEGSSAAAAEEEKDDDDGYEMSEDDMITFIEKGGLKGVMPLTEETAGFLGIEGLYDDDGDEYDEVDESYFEEYYTENGYTDDDFKDDDNEKEGHDDKELVYDGVFEEMYNPNEYEDMSSEEEEQMAKMNREQRRAAEKNRKKRKLPFRGFGSRD